MAKFRRPQDLSFLQVPYLPLAQDLQQVKDRDFKAPPNHIQCVLDGLSCMFWYNARGRDECKDYLKENHGNIFFYSNKILKEDKEKDVKWTNCYTDLATALKDFVTARAETICDWAGTEDAKGAQAFYEAECKKGASAPATPASAPKVEEKKEAPAAQPKPAPAKAAPKAKQPVKVKNINRWTIENYTEAQTLRFEGE